MEFMKQIVEKGVYITAFSATFRTEKKRRNTPQKQMCASSLSQEGSISV